MSDLVFECPSCGNMLLEEVMGDCTVSSIISIDAINGDPSYGEMEATGEGYTLYYQCSQCGYEIPDISTTNDLIEWLLELPENEQYRKNFEMEENDE